MAKKPVAYFLASLLFHSVFLGAFLFSRRTPTRPAIFVNIEANTGSSALRFAPATSPAKAPALRKSSVAPTEKGNAPAARGGPALMPSSAISGAETSPILGSALGLRIDYPRVSRILGEEGSAVIEFRMNPAQGSFTPAVYQSSGHPRLDHAALVAAEEGLERGILSEVLRATRPLRVRFVFRLTGEAKER